MATVASTMLGLYVGILAPVFPGIGGHLLIANLLSAPAAVLMARILVPAPREKISSAEAPGETTPPELLGTSPRWQRGGSNHPGSE